MSFSADRGGAARRRKRTEGGERGKGAGLGRGMARGPGLEVGIAEGE